MQFVDNYFDNVKLYAICRQFKNGVRRYGRNWKEVARDYVHTRTPDQIFKHSNNVENRDFMKTIPRKRQ